MLAAVNIMKKRKMYQMQFEKLEQIKMTLETQAINLESAAQTAEAFQAMTAGNDTMKKIRHEVGIDDVDDVMDDMQEEMQLAQEVSTAIGQPVDMTMGTIDDDDLMAELEQMDEADLSAQFDQAALGRPSATAAESMPSAPTSKLGLSKKEEDDLNRLQAELAF
mmetsp:Transcript_34005/g.48319  ORF Transcript_34005/g.48319 Transcript_34005/m.48319 type:complete len:164 (+) Transcript_34005:139-630(+)